MVLLFSRTCTRISPLNSKGVSSNMPNDRDKKPTENAANHELLLTRRHFFYGALGVGALAVAASNPALTQNAYAADDELTYLEVPENKVFTLDDCTEVLSDTMVALIGSFNLPYGTLLWTSGDSIAACLLPTEGSKPLTQVGILYLGAGTYHVILEEAVGQSEGFDIYDVRANEKGLIWTEANIFSGIWRIYTASFIDGNLGTPALVDEGDEGWETPTIAVVDEAAFWQVLPVATGPHQSENSLLKWASFGKANAETIYHSEGRMSTPPYPLKDSLVITPRTYTDAVHHQLTLIDGASTETKDSLVLPAGMKPLEAGYGNTGFTFSFDGIYSYGDGIANLGTYAPGTAHSTYDYEGKTWFRFGKTPSAAPSWCNDLFVVKSTRSVCGVNLSEKTYCAIDVESGSDSYGDYLASTGVNETFVTYANVDSTSIEGEENKYCLVRVWTTLA